MAHGTRAKGPTARSGSRGSVYLHPGAVGLDQPQKAGQGCPPTRAAGSLQPCQMFGPVMGVRILCPTVGMMRNSAEEIEIGAVHGFRPETRFPAFIARIHAIIRISNFLGTKAEVTCHAGVIFPRSPRCGPSTPPRDRAASPRRAAC